MRLYDPEVQKMRFEITLNSHSGTFKGKPCPPTMCDYRQAGPSNGAAGQNVPYPNDGFTWGGICYPPMLRPTQNWDYTQGAMTNQVPLDNWWRHADGQKDEATGWTVVDAIRRFVQNPAGKDPRCSTGSASVWPDNGACGEQFTRQGRVLSNTVQMATYWVCDPPNHPSAMGFRNRRGLTTATGIGTWLYPWRHFISVGSPWYTGILVGAQYTGRNAADGVALQYPTNWWINSWDKSLLTAPTNSVVNWQGLPLQAPPADDCAGMIISVKDFTWGCNWDCQPKTNDAGAQVYGADRAAQGEGGLYPPDMQDNYMGGTDHPSLPTCFPYQTLGIALMNNTSKNAIESLQTARPRARYGRPLNPENNFEFRAANLAVNPLPWGSANNYQYDFGPNGQGSQFWTSWTVNAPNIPNPYVSYKPLQGVGGSERYDSAGCGVPHWGVICGAKARTRCNKYNPIGNQTLTTYASTFFTPSQDTSWYRGSNVVGTFDQSFYRTGTTGVCTGDKINTGNALCEANPRQAKMIRNSGAVTAALDGEVSWTTSAALPATAPTGQLTQQYQPPGFGIPNEDLGTPINPLGRGTGWIVNPPTLPPPIANPAMHNPIYSKRLCSFQTKGYKVPNNFGSCFSLATGWNSGASYFGFNAMMGATEGGSMGAMNLACWCAYADYHATDPVKEGVYFPYMPLDEITLGIIDDAGNEMIHRYGSSGSQKWTLPMMSTPWQCTLTIQYIPKKKK